MNKKLLALLCVLIATMMLFGACAAAPQSQEEATASATPDAESTVVVAKVNGEPIYYDEYYKVYKSACAQYGVSEDDATYGDYLKNMVLDSLVNQEIMTQKLTEEGYMDLTDEQKAEAEENAQAELDSMIDYYYKSTIEAELGEGYTKEEYEAAKAPYREELLTQMGTTEEEYKALFVLPVAQDAAKQAKVGDIIPTDADVQAKYDENVAADKEAMDADPSVYESTVSSGATAYYIPAGVRNVRQVLIGIDEDTVNAISLLRGEEFTAQADYLLEKALAEVKAKADDVLAKIKSGKMTFEEAIASYNDDKGMPETGYPVTKDSKTYVESFTTGAMGLGKVGDVSDLVASDYGYHIIEYFSDLPAGAVALDTVKEEIYDTLVTTMQDEAWQKVIDEWTTTSKIETFKENL